MTTYHKIYMNHVQSSNLQSQLCAMWKKQALCDAVIRSDNILIRAHRVVLVASCPMLQSMENSTSGSQLEIRVPSDIQRESIMTFLQYLYEGFLMLTEVNCRQVEKLARMLHMDNVISCCADFNKCMSSSSPYIYGPTDQADFKHVRITNLMKVRDFSQKRSQSLENSGNVHSKKQRLPSFGTTESFDHASSDSCTDQPETWLEDTPLQNDSRREGIELFQAPLIGKPGPRFISPQTVSLSLTTQSNTSTDKRVIDITKTQKKTSPSFKSSTSTSETGLVDLSNVSSFSMPSISEVRSFQTGDMDSNPDEAVEILQNEPFPVAIMEVPQSADSVSHGASDSSTTCATSRGRNNEPSSGQSSSMQKMTLQQQTDSHRKSKEKQKSLDVSAASSVRSPGDDISVIKVEPEDVSFPDQQYTNPGAPEYPKWNEGQINPAGWSQSGISVSTEESLPPREMSPRQMNVTDEGCRGNSGAISENGSSGEISSQDLDSLRQRHLGTSDILFSPPPPLSAGFGHREFAFHPSMFTDPLTMNLKDVSTEIITCLICHKVFSTKSGQKLHMDRFHPDPRKSNFQKFPKCKICGKQMASKYALTIHEIKHSGQRAFKCELCGSTFGYKSVLKKHMEVCSQK